MARTRAQANKAIRQEALREQLANQGHLQHVLETLEKIDELDPTDDSFKNSLDKYKVSNEQRIKLMSKYIPDLKSQEIDMTHGVNDQLLSLLAEIDGNDTGLPEE